MSSLTPEDLSPELKEEICTGCGPNYYAPIIPELAFTPACDQHDLDYVVGGTESDRYNSDRLFLNNMLEIARSKSWWRRWYLYPLAYVYYQAVRLLGRRYYYYGQPKTLEQLEDEYLV